MAKVNIVETLHMQPLTEEEKTSRHILGRLYGPIATCKESTRNGRHYNKDLWEKALADEIFQEKVKNKSLFLELGHPTDREETLMEKVCACIPEMPKIVDGDLYAYVDILDTANGRLLKTLCDYGFIPGISSRGSGDVVGDEVDPDTFYLETWDIVQTPALKGARLAMAESLDKNAAGLKKALCEELAKADDSDKKIIQESLDSLNIKLDEAAEQCCKEEKEECNSEECCSDKECGDAKETVEKVEEAIDEGSDSLIKSLQEALTAKAELEKQNKELQEKLAVSDTKVSELNEELGRYKTSTARLAVISKDKTQLEKKVSYLEEQLKVKEVALGKTKSRLSSLTESVRKSVEAKSTINEEIESKNTEIKSLNEQIEGLKVKYDALVEELNNEINTAKEASDLKEKDYQSKLEQTENLVESWKKVANSTVKHYIESRATMLGVKPEEIKNRLPESYNIKDIDSVCESLQTYSLSINKLPFSVNKNIGVKIRESKNEPLISKTPLSEDDEIDNTLLTIAKL